MTRGVELPVPTIKCKITINIKHHKSTICVGANPWLQLLFENSKSIMSIFFWRITSPMVWVPLLIVNKSSEFQVNIFSNDRGIRNCRSFCMTTMMQTTPKMTEL